MSALIHTLIAPPQSILEGWPGIEEQWFTAYCCNSVVAVCLGRFLVLPFGTTAGCCQQVQHNWVVPLVTLFLISSSSKCSCLS